MMIRTRKIAEIFLIVSLPVSLLVACNSKNEIPEARKSLHQSQSSTVAPKPATAPAGFVVTPSKHSNSTIETAALVQEPATAKDETTVNDKSAKKLQLVSKPERNVILFPSNRFYISENDRGLLKQHARYLKYNPDFVLHVSGYSDSAGPADVNFELSMKRAENVESVLLDEGVSESQIKVYAYGEAFALQNKVSTYNDRRVELDYVERNYEQTAALSD